MKVKEEQYKIWKSGEKWSVILSMKTTESEARKQAQSLTDETGEQHIAVLEGSRCDQFLRRKNANR